MGNNRRRLPLGQDGLASIVVVSVLIVIMTLITVGFARLVNRAAVSSANKQFSTSATYAAQSAINDVASYLKKYAANNPGSNFLPQSTSCTGSGSLIGNSASPGPFYSSYSLAANASTRYTCLLLNPTPSTLVYTQVQNLKSQVVKVNTSASSGALDKMMISWQPSDNTVNGYPTSSSNLNDETTWNSPTGACKDASSTNASCIPMLRVAIFPISNGEALSAAQAQSKTVFLYPKPPSGNVPNMSFASLIDGSLVPVNCNQTIAVSDFNPTTVTGYNCNLIISSFSTAISPSNTDSIYLRITPIYNQADVRIATNDKFGNTLNFINDQAVVDATAQTSGVVKRLQARIDTSSLVSGAGGVDTNIASGGNNEPEQAIRSSTAICKREIQTTPSVAGYPSFINFDDPDAVCHDLGSTTTITNPVPTLTLGITGNNGTDNGRSVDSQANNPDSPQSPVQQGTVFVGTSPGSNDGNARINWTTTDATSCTATGGSGGWAGEKNGLMTFSGSPATNGAGSQNFSGIGSITTYGLQCSRPYAPSPTPTKTVTIWPYPQVTGLSSTSARAGKNYTVSWSSNNAKPNGCVLSGGNWSSPGNTNNSGSETMNWPVNDNSTDRAFTVTCYDPIGRSDSRTIHVNPNGGDTGGGGSGVAPPYCSASVSTSGSTTNDATISWSTSCPDWDPSNICQASRDIEPSPNASGLPGYYQGLGSPCWQSSGTIRLTRGGTYTLTASVWAVPWSDQGSANSTGCSSNCDGAARSSATITVYPPLTVSGVSETVAWDQGPECSYPNPASPYNGYNDTWWCRANRFPTGDTNPGCADGVHRWTMCAGAFSFTVSGGGGNYSCSVGVYGYGVFMNASGSAGGSSTLSNPSNEGWIDSGAVNGYFYVTCNDSVGSPQATWWPYGSPW